MTDAERKAEHKRRVAEMVAHGVNPDDAERSVAAELMYEGCILDDSRLSRPIYTKAAVRAAKQARNQAPRTRRS